ncbi:MAG: PEFG-CTERM sorting domain-containing protein [Thaumarchaeota archaeon]|nr:PEFG-CTERM sorting domain-containing protein [Nitrososphaerota archaeon]MBI3641743.1 PEFG-CTERM sorting domain-containing protein [Nitrososphaerota archaeon]
MSTRFSGFALLAILAAATATIPVFADNSTQNPYQNPILAGTTNPQTSTGVPITVTTDKTSYNDGDKLTISGTTQDFITGTPVSVIVRNPIGNVVQIAQVDLGSDRTYSTTITVGSSSLWQAAGTYEVDVQFGSKDRSAKTTFQFTGSNGGAPSGPTIKVDGTDFSVTYSITNGKVLGIKADVQSKSLIVSIQTTGDGQLTIDLPRALIDAKKNDNQTDDQFFVINDGQETQFTETSTTTDRTLTIPFTDGTGQIEIIGTWIVPEFGPIAALVLAIAIISIIAVSAKTGLRFMPKY